MLLSWEQRLYFLAFFVATCGHVTTFWPMQCRRKCVRLICTFLHFLPLLFRLECRVVGWNFRTHVGPWGGGLMTWGGGPCAFWELLFCSVNTRDCYWVNGRRNSGPSRGQLQAVLLQTSAHILIPGTYVWTHFHFVITLFSEFPSSSSSRNFTLLFCRLRTHFSNFLVIGLLLEVDCINIHRFPCLPLSITFTSDLPHLFWAWAWYMFD